jgi:hypothetical protein
MQTQKVYLPVYTDEEIIALAEKVKRLATTIHQEINREGFLKVASMLRDESHKIGFDQDKWCNFDQTGLQEFCNTTACVAGHASYAAGLTMIEMIILEDFDFLPEEQDRLLKQHIDTFDLMMFPLLQIGAAYLGVGTSDRLFKEKAHGWTDVYKNRYQSAQNYAERRIIAAEYLEAIAAGEIEEYR